MLEGEVQVAKQAPFFTQSTNLHPLKFINRRLFGLNPFAKKSTRPPIDPI
jgi:hypothetical protein